MRNEEEIPFGRGIAQSIIFDSGSAQAFRSFIVATREARKVSGDALSAAKCKVKAESHEDFSAAVSVSKLFAYQGSIIKKGSTPKYSKMNTTFNTDKPQSFQTPNVLENSSQILKEPNRSSRSN